MTDVKEKVNPVEDKSFDGTHDSSEMQIALSSPEPGSSITKPWIKMDLVLLPMVTGIFFLSYSDVNNVGNARVAGLQGDLHISNKQFSVLLTISALAGSLFQMPINYVTVIVGPRVMIPAIMVLMGAASSLQGVVHNLAGLLAARFIAAAMEGALRPGIIIYLSCFYPRRMLALRMAILYSAVPLASSFSSLLAAAIIHMDGIAHKPGWAWLFILEGLICVGFAILSFVVLPNTPESMWFLRSQERKLVTRTLREDGMLAGPKGGHGKFWPELWNVVRQPHVLLLSFTGILVEVTVTGFGFFLPSIVAGLGYTGSAAQLMSAPPCLVSAIVTVIASILSDRYACRGIVMLASSALATIGLAIYIASTNDHTKYASLFLSVSGGMCISPILDTWLANNTAPLLRRTTAIAFASIVARLGVVFSVWLFGTISPPPEYTVATITLLAFQVGVFCCTTATVVYLVWKNRSRASLRAVRANEEGSEEMRCGGSDRSGLISNDNVSFEYLL